MDVSMWRSTVVTECEHKTYSCPVWLFRLPSLPPLLLDRAPCSQTDETTMFSISRPSWGYRKIKSQVPRTWLTTPLQHQCVVTPISSPSTETNPTTASIFCDSESAHPTDWPSSLRAMSISFIAMMTLVGSSVVIAFVLQPSKEELQAPANAPLPHHRSVPWCRF